MNHHYNDIINKLGPPLFWDECAVPRYCDFGPNETANIYAREVALLEIACQDCGQLFKVVVSWSETDWPSERLSNLVENNEIHYGDPPNDGCCLAGPTMNSVPKRVIEFWQKRKFEWVRVSELEREIKVDWAD